PAQLPFGGAVDDLQRGARVASGQGRADGVPLPRALRAALLRVAAVQAPEASGAGGDELLLAHLRSARGDGVEHGGQLRIRGDGERVVLLVQRRDGLESAATALGGEGDLVDAGAGAAAIDADDFLGGGSRSGGSEEERREPGAAKSMKIHAI